MNGNSAEAWRAYLAQAEVLAADELENVGGGEGFAYDVGRVIGWFAGGAYFVFKRAANPDYVIAGQGQLVLIH